ncbi:MAG: glycosyltransferase [Candidatus Omnitrophica bacterium]|nr:glycosyltransferase [Candidatus Omnitrophota bacterium]
MMVSVVIPCKNEAGRLPAFLEILRTYIQTRPERFEVIVVDDGSTDQTSSVVLNIQTNWPILRLIRNPVNRGKGFAVKRGFFAAQGDIVLFLDADGSTLPDEIGRNLHFFSEGYDILIGSRAIPGQEQGVKAKWYRRFIGRIFNGCVHAFLFQNIHDTQCGFKMFRREVVAPLFSRLVLNGFGFDIELLYLAVKLGFRIKEVPIVWVHKDGSKVSLWKDSIRMFVNILQVRNWHCTPINVHDVNIRTEELQFMSDLENRHWWFLSKAQLVRVLLKAHGGRTGNILDAGCGTGFNFTVLKDFGRTFGFDITPQALHFCRKNTADVPLSLSSGQSLCFKNKSFVWVTALDLIEHISDPHKALCEFYRVLQDDGRVLLTVPALRILWSQHDEALCHFRRYEKKDVRLLAEDTGFEIERIGFFFFTAFLVVFPIRLLRRLRAGHGSMKSDTTTLPPPFLNWLLQKICFFESWVIRSLSLPVGTTIYAVLKKKSGAAV